MKIFKTILVCIAVIGFIAFLKYRSVSKAIAEHANFAPPPESVTTVVAKSEVWNSYLEAVGTTAAVQGVTLMAEEPGKVTRILVESGANVQAGNVIIELDTSTEQAQLQSALAKLELARTNLVRGKSLRPTNAVSQSDLDSWTFQAKQLEADAAAIRSMIAKKTITAPFSGKLGIRQVNIGQFVKQGDPIIPLFANDPLYVNFTVPQQDVGKLKIGLEVKLGANSYAQEEFRATISAINPQVEMSTKNVEVQATVPNPEGKLLPGMFVTLAVVLQEAQTVMPLPASAISYAPYGNSVFVIEASKTPDGKETHIARQRFVKLGPKRGDQVAVLEGIKAGDEVATSGLFKIRPGGNVFINNSIAPSNSPDPNPLDT